MSQRWILVKKDKTDSHLFVNTEKCVTFVTVFHGIRFKVRRLFVVMTGNFFILWFEEIFCSCNLL